MTLTKPTFWSVENYRFNFSIDINQAKTNAYPNLANFPLQKHRGVSFDRLVSNGDLTLVVLVY